MTIFGETMTLLASPEGHELFFKAKEDEFSACKSYQFTVPIFGPGVVYDATPEVLVEQRMFAGGALSVRRFKLYVPMIEKECEEYFANAWGESGEVDLMQAFNEITMLTSTRCLQGN
jgi:sterol 14-demethylase